MDHLKTKGTKAFIWDFFGKMATHGMGFIVTIFLARLLEPSDFGLIALIMVIIGIATVFTDVGLGAALIQRRRVHPSQYTSVFYFNIFIGLLLTLTTYFSASFISTFYDNEQLLLLVQVMSFLFVINAFSSVQSTRLHKELNFALLTKIGLLSSLTSGIIGISLAFYGAGVWSLAAQALSMGILYNILIWTLAKWIPSREFSWKALTQLWGFGFRMFLVGLLDAIYTRLDYLIIGKLFDPNTLGFYQRAKSLNMMAIQYSSGSLMSVLFPVLSKVQNDLPRFQNIILKSLGIISFIVFLLFGSLYLVSEELIVILFSDKWFPSVEYFKILAFSGFAYPINALLVNVLSSRGNSKAFLRMAIYKKFVAFSNLGIGFLFGIEGFLYGLIIVAVINTSITIVMASRESSIPIIEFYRLIIVQVMIAALALLTTLFAVEFLSDSNIISLLIKLVLFSTVYIFLNWIFKTLSFQYFLEQFLPVLRKIVKKLEE
ncbi:MAG: lipopolysaccharide biosynthesis protein [Sulfurimonadaceae bacterium]